MLGLVDFCQGAFEPDFTVAVLAEPQGLDSKLQHSHSEVVL